MRAAFAILLLTATASFIDAANAQQRWCAISNEGSSNCSFASMTDCRAQVSGSGGNCMPEAPVGHRQPTPSARAANLPKDNLDAMLERVNKKDSKIQLCRGC